MFSSFQFLDGFLWCTRVFNFREIKFIYFSFVTCYFIAIFEKLFLNPRSWKFLPLFSTMNSIVSIVHFVLDLFWVNLHIKGGKVPSSFCFWYLFIGITCQRDDSIPQFSSFQPLNHVRFLWPNGLQLAKLPCPSPTPGVFSNSCPLSRWCHPTISSSVVPFSYCLQSFPALKFFQWVSSLHQMVKLLEFQLQL